MVTSQYTYPKVYPEQSLDEFARVIAKSLGKDTGFTVGVIASPYRLVDVEVWYDPAKDTYFVEFYSPLRNPGIKDNENFKRFHAAYEYAVDTIKAHALVEREELLRAEERKPLAIERIILERRLKDAKEISNETYDRLRKMSPATKAGPVGAALIYSFEGLGAHLESLEKSAIAHGFENLAKRISELRKIHQKRVEQVKRN